MFELPGVPAAELPQKCGCVEGRAGQSPCSKGATYTSPTPFSADFHTASLNWTTDSAGLSRVVIGLDGAVVSTITSPCLVEELGMDFDRETMPGWMALPEPQTLPDRPAQPRALLCSCVSVCAAPTL